MARKKKQARLHSVPWKIVLPVAHIIYDVATTASCPRCRSRVVLYVCPRCKRFVMPNRQGPVST
jgi:DNA-directed RNA polymerase subunit RPC12/RpoP